VDLIGQGTAKPLSEMPSPDGYLDGFMVGSLSQRTLKDGVAYMSVNVLLTRDGNLIISPQDFYVTMGDLVTWVFSGDSYPHPVEYLIYFSDDRAVGSSMSRLVGNNGSLALHAATRGDWKYGIRVTNSNGEVIGDDDPYLHVR
jgi:plastocyanin